MDNVSDLSKYHSLCFVTIIQVKVISGHQVKRSNQIIRDIELRCMFLGQIFANSTKNDPKTFVEASKSIEKMRKILVMSQNDVKVPVFDMFYVITQSFLKI